MLLWENIVIWFVFVSAILSNYVLSLPLPFLCACDGWIRMWLCVACHVREMRAWPKSLLREACEWFLWMWLIDIGTDAIRILWICCDSWVIVCVICESNRCISFFVELCFYRSRNICCWKLFFLSLWSSVLILTKGLLQSRRYHRLCTCNLWTLQCNLYTLQCNL